MLQNEGEDWNYSWEEEEEGEEEEEEEEEEEGGITIRVGWFFEQRQLTEEIWNAFFSEVFLAVVQSSFRKTRQDAFLQHKVNLDFNQPSTFHTKTWQLAFILVTQRCHYIFTQVRY